MEVTIKKRAHVEFFFIHWSFQNRILLNSDTFSSLICFMIYQPRLTHDADVVCLTKDAFSIENAALIRKYIQLKYGFKGPSISV